MTPYFAQPPDFTWAMSFRCRDGNQSRKTSILCLDSIKIQVKVGGDVEAKCFVIDVP